MKVLEIMGALKREASRTASFFCNGAEFNPSTARGTKGLMNLLVTKPAQVPYLGGFFRQDRLLAVEGILSGKGDSQLARRLAACKGKGEDAVQAVLRNQALSDLWKDKVGVSDTSKRDPSPMSASAVTGTGAVMQQIGRAHV